MSKGNLYPFACHNVSSWPERAVTATGTTDKDEYRRWCQEHRLPTIKKWIDEYQPRMVVGVGIGCRSDFTKAVFGQEVDLREKVLSVNGHQKRLFYFTQGWRRLVVIPHFSGAYGLNSNASLQEAGGCKNNCVRGWFTSDRHPVAVQDDELVESRFPVADGHGPFLGDVA